MAVFNFYQKSFCIAAVAHRLTAFAAFGFNFGMKQKTLFEFPAAVKIIYCHTGNADEVKRCNKYDGNSFHWWSKYMTKDDECPMIVSFLFKIIWNVRFKGEELDFRLRTNGSPQV